MVVEEASNICLESFQLKFSKQLIVKIEEIHNARALPTQYLEKVIANTSHMVTSSAKLHFMGDIWDLKEIQFVRLCRVQPGYHARNITLRFYDIGNIVVG